MVDEDNKIYSRSLADILPDGMVSPAVQDCVIAGLSLDSRKVKKGDVFFACKGQTVDGRQYIQKAIEMGAAAVIAEKAESVSGGSFSMIGDASVPVIEIENLNQLVGVFASRFFGNPSQQLKVIAVTGTNGKTTCAHLLSGVIEQVAGRCAVVGTLGTGLVGELSESGFTTPDAIVLQKLFFDWLNEGVEWVVIETSSHGLDQGRLNGTHFHAAILTNITRDHLDYHGSFETYRDAKKALFLWPGLKIGILNADDESGALFLKSMSSNVDVISYGFSDRAQAQMSDLVLSPKGLSFTLSLPRQGFLSVSTLKIDSPLVGEFNAYNIAACALLLLALGFGVEAVQQLCATDGPPGRMQQVVSDAVEGPMVIVDYAHTPDALENVLKAVAAHKHSKLWCVFGCGGDRDKGKRPIMGAIAERLADRVVLTDDNPRSERSADIIADIVAGMKGRNHQIIANRAEAIHRVINEADVDDIIMVAGKGHESYQESGGIRKPFSDVEQALSALSSLKQSGLSV